MILDSRQSYEDRSKVFVNLIVLLAIFAIFASADIDILYRKDICDEEEFYSPYVRLLRTRQPYHENFPLVKLLAPGFISVAKYTGILCINGPAIVYTDVSVDSVCMPDQWIPSYGEPQLFSHDCFSINRLSRDAYMDQNNELTKDSKVFGNKVFGVYLLGMSPDYREPNFAFYSGPNYAYIPGSSYCVHNGASVAFVANSTDTSAHCYSVKKYNMEGAITAAYPGNPIFCYREDRDDEIDSPWHKGENPLVGEDVIWDNPNIPCRSSSVQGEMEMDPAQMPDFRMIHPKFWSSQGSKGIVYKAKKKQMNIDEIPVYTKPNPPGSLFPGEPGWNDPVEMIHFAPVISGPGSINDGNDESETTVEPLQKFQTELSNSDCEEVPKPPETCEPDMGDPCLFLNHVLTLESTDWKSEQMKDGSWRLPILNLVNSVYEKVCPQVTKFLAPALSRVFQVFLTKSTGRNATLKEKFNQQQKHEWLEMTMDLERCEERAEAMTFFKQINSPAIAFKENLENQLTQLYEAMYAKRDAAMKLLEEKYGGSSLDTLDSLVASSGYLGNDKNATSELEEIEKIRALLNEIPLKFPYKIYVGAIGSLEFSKASEVRQYREAAEIDHELDWAIDAYWKVVTTVLGYCNMHYSSRDASTFMRLYDSFSKDFFDYVAEDWIKGENKITYDQLFGEFIHGPGTLWLDACQNGAYQWTETSELRPLRPLTLNEGDTPPEPLSETGNHAAPANFFIDNLGWSTDHYDYSEHNNNLDGQASEQHVQNNMNPEPFYTNNYDSGVKTAIIHNILDPHHHFT